MNDDEKPKEQSFTERIAELKHKSPFEKFKVTMTSGSSYTIEHPDLLAIGESRMTYYLPKTDRSVEMRLNQISEVEQTGEFLQSPAK
jgi:hypothetical protein